ncbi:MAG: saccharopine dehydrogenase [bacterium]|nr:saccharopine dehydrogenase [bacterium]
MKKKIILLGAGLVGGPMAADLAKETNFDVYAVDYDKSLLEKLEANHPVTTIQKDLSNALEVKELVKDYDYVINAVPGHMGFRTLEAIIEAGKDVVDIAFYPEDPFLLDKKAKENNVTVLVDYGVAPGMSNVLIGHVDSLLDETENVLIYVGGLPEIREWPYEYKAVFSPFDVIEEYVRPARYVENGHMVIRPALSDAEFINFPGVGTLEAFNSDGLRSLAFTIDAPNLKEKTLRYPGHIEKMAVLRETGFFDQEEIEINGTKIRPLDFTAKLLFPKWEMKDGDVDLTVLQVIIEGKKDGVSKRYEYNMLDKLDKETNTHSMARTTGYTATVGMRMLVKGLYNQKGISPPEYVGKHKQCVDFMLEGLKERNIFYKETISKEEKKLISK